MGKKFTMYWSSLETYERCPRQFLWMRGWGDIDLGNGPGKKKYPKTPRSRHHAIMGIVVGKAVEDIYNNKLWMSPKTIVSEVKDSVQRNFTLELNRPGNFIDWTMAPQQSEMLEVCMDGAVGYVRTMKRNKFLGTWNRAEYDLQAYIDKMNPIGGRPDIVFRREDTGLTVLDGKNSQKKDKYVNQDQLRWYSLVSYLAHNSKPDRLGFVYYRFPYDESTGETGVSWVECTEDHLMSLSKRAREVRRAMDESRDESDFEPNPVPSVCRFCDFEPECPERQDQKSKNAAKRKRKKRGPDVDDGSLGVSELKIEGHK